MKNILLFALVLSIASACRPQPVKPVDDTVKFGIISKTNSKQEYEEFFLKIDDENFNWKITEPNKKTVKRISLAKGVHNYELTVKSMINSSAGKDLIIGTSSGRISIDKSKDLELVWDKKMKDNVYKVSLK